MTQDRIEARPRAAGRALPLLALLALGACASNAIQVPGDSLTVQRITGQAVEVPPLMPAPGNVWPAPEPERATLAAPDVLGRPMEPLEPLPPASTRGRRGSSTPPDLLAPGVDPAAPPPINPGPAGDVTPPQRRSDGRVIPVPGGPPAVITGGGPGYSTYTQPGGGSGIATPNGATTTLLGQDGSVRQVPNPR